VSRRLKWIVAMIVLAVASSPLRAQPKPASLDAPNVVAISPRLVTSGQPTAASLATLAAQGFGAVIYLAPPTVPDAVRDEKAIVEGQGLAFVNIPINFGKPVEADFDAFRAALDKLSDRKVLVHCQINLRASTMVFLHRVLVEGVPPEQAYAAVAGVWTPEGPWKALVVELLQKRGIAFEPY